MRQRMWRISVFLAWLVVAAPLARPLWAQGESSNAAKSKYSAAAQMQNEGLFELAADEYREFLKEFPEDPLVPKARHYLGVCLIQKQKYPEAVEALTAVVEKYPKFSLLDETLLNLGSAQYNIALGAKKPEGFAAPAATYGKLIEKFPESKLLPAALYNQGESYYALGNKASAATAYAKLLEKFPGHKLRPDALYALGVTQLELKKPAEAAAAFATFLKEFPEHKLAPRIVMFQGDALYDQQKYAEAAKRFAEAAAKKDFEQADRATMRQADALTMQKKYAEAAALFALVPDKFPKSPLLGEIPLLAGNRYLLAGDRKTAVKWLKQAVESGGKDAPQAAHWLARCYLELKQPAEALAVADKLLPKAADSEYLVDLKLDRADALYDLSERRGESVAAYAAIASEHPKATQAPQALYNAAWASFNLAKYDAALKHARDFASAYPSHELASAARVVVADSLLNSDKSAEAAAEYRALIEKNPNHADKEHWQVLLAWALRRDKKYGEVIALLDPIKATLKTPQRQAEALYLIGVSRYAEKQYAPAREALEASLKAKPDWSQADEVLLLLARAQRQVDDLKGAEATLRRLIAEQPKSAALDRANYHLGELFYAAERYQDAAEQYAKVLKQWPQSSVAVPALYWLGWSQLLRDKPAEADATFTQLIDKHGTDELVPPARFARAKARRLLGKHAEAIVDITEYLKSQPAGEDKSGALLERGLAELELKRHADAAKTFDALLTADPKYSAADRVLYNLGWALRGQNREADATAAFARLAKDYATSPFAAEALYHVAEADYGQKKYDAAAAKYTTSLEKAREAGQKDVAEMSAHKRAWCLYHQDQFDKAHEAFAAQVKNFADGQLAADGAFMEAECLLKLEKYKEADVAYKQVLAKLPSSPDFQVLALLHAAQVASQLERWDDAISLAQQVSEKFPQSDYRADALYEIAWAQQNKKQLDKAAELYAQVATMTQREVGARARLMLGEVKFEKGEHADAIRDFFKVFRGYPDASPSCNRWKAQAAYEAARCYEVLKKPAEALKFYQEVVAKYPQSQVAPLARKRVEALSGSSS